MNEITGVCVRCGYDLYGIANEAACPECGLLAERSRRPSEQLRDGDPAYLFRLSTGTWLFLVALVFPFIWSVVLIVGEAFIGSWSRFRASPHLYFAGFDLCAIVFVTSVFLLTSADRRDDPSEGRIRRFAIRVLAILPLLCLALFHLSIEMDSYQWRGGFGGTPYTLADMLMNLLYGIQIALMAATSVVFPTLFFFHLRDLGRRLLSRQIAEHSAIVGIGVSVTALVGFALTFFGSNLDVLQSMGRRNRENVYLCLVVILSAFSILFALWTLFLLIRFAIAFASEARMLKHSWQMADRSDPAFFLEEQRYSY